MIFTSIVIGIIGVLAVLLAFNVLNGIANWIGYSEGRLWFVCMLMLFVVVSVGAYDILRTKQIGQQQQQNITEVKP